VANDIRRYLQELKDALVSAGADPALIQDALFDAEEYLQAEMASDTQGADAGSPPMRDDAAGFAEVVEGYGSPAEVAAAYLGDTAVTVHEPMAVTSESVTPLCSGCGSHIEAYQTFCTSCGSNLRVGPAPSPPTAGQTPEELPAGVQQGMQATTVGGPSQPSVWRLIFGPFAEQRVWTSLVYMILSLATGIAYFTIVVTGLSVAGGMSVLIVGLPLFMLVLATIRGLALLEGRLVEGLLGTRMPRRGRSTPPNLGFWNRMLWWLKDGHTWASLAYMLLMLPLGIIYFTIAVTGLSLGLGLVTTPIWGWLPWLHRNTAIVINGVSHQFWPAWTIPISFVLGILLLIGFMHLVKWIGRGHAALAKAMLVRLN
jgi:hypothetical protein